MAAAIIGAATTVTLIGMWAFRVGALRSRVLDEFAQLAHNEYFHVMSEPLRVRIGTDSRATGIPARLERAGWVRVEEKPRAGEFQVTRGAITYREPATAPDGKERTVTLYLDGPVVRRIQASGKHADTVLLPREHLTSFRASLRERRTPIVFADLPEALVRSVLAAEDRRFFSHRGLDGRGIARALFRNLRAGRVVEGGSTITQQVVKQIMRRSDRAVNAKIDEAFLALSIERKFSKQQILQVYLNEVYLGQEGSFQIHGVAEGAHHLFSKPLATLTLQEHINLAATIRAPNARSPRRNADRLAAYAAAISQALGSVQMPEPTPDAELAARGRLRPGATRTTQRIHFASSQIGYAFDQLEREWSEARKTFRVQPPAVLECSIDPVLQTQAAAALEHGLESARRTAKRSQQPLQGAVVVLDAVTGALRAAVGGRNYTTAPFNRALDIERPVGSTIKPLVFLAAFGGMEPTPRYTQSSWLPDEPREYRVGKRIWEPANFDGEYHGWVTARQALARSLNGATVALGMDVGVRKVARLAMDLGLAAQVPENPSIFLGAVDTSPLRVAAAYAALANGGFVVQPRALLAVESNGQTHALADAERRRVLDPRVCYVVNDMLVAALRSGTGASARAHGFVHVATGKTGTTNDTRDAWFVGSTPEIVCAVWVGYDDNTPVGLTGAHGALPVWARLMTTWLGDGWDREFQPPAGITFREIDPASGELAQRSCDAREVAAYLDGTAPVRTCSDHGARHWYAFGDSIDDAERERFGTRRKGGLWAKLKRALGG